MGIGAGGGFLSSFNPITMLATTVLGQLVGSAFSKKQDAAPAPAAVAPAKPAPQASTAPEVNTVRNQVAGTTGDGQASTLLTGLGGVDPKTLNLGKSTLLGE